MDKKHTIGVVRNMPNRAKAQSARRRPQRPQKRGSGFRHMTNKWLSMGARRRSKE